jgi:hypothetical protein
MWMEMQRNANAQCFHNSIAENQKCFSNGDLMASSRGRFYHAAQ